MDNNDNPDGLGLPMESWMPLPHLSSGLVNPAYSHQAAVSAQALHGYMSHRSLLTEAGIGPSSPTVSPASLPQYGLSSSSLHQAQHFPLSHERSAWSHLLSMDPLAANIMGAHLSDPSQGLRHCLPHSVAHAVNTRSDSMLMFAGNNKMTAPFDNTRIPKMQLHPGSSVPIPYGSYSSIPGMAASQGEMMAQFSSFVNQSKKASADQKLPASLTVSTDMPSFESSRSYSPVSPPADDDTEMASSGQSCIKEPELLIRESNDISTASFPLFSASDHADIFNYLSEKADSPDLGLQGSFSEPMSSLLDTSDSPLDMTTATISQSEKEFCLKEKTQCAPDLASKDSFNEFNAPAYKERTISVIADKVIKPTKSTPKKSNFYGRDASLFSFDDVSSSCIGEVPGYNTQFPPQFPEVVDNDVGEFQSCLNNSEESSDTVCTQEQDQLDVTFENDGEEDSSALTINFHKESNSETDIITTEPRDNTVVAGSQGALSLDVTNLAFTQNNLVVPKTLLETESEMDQSNDLVKANDIKDPSVLDSVSPDHAKSIGDIESDDSSKTDIEEDLGMNIQQPAVYLENIVLPLKTPVRKTKVAKRKKRKATGFQNKPRKKYVKKQEQNEHMDAVDNVVNIDSNEIRPNMGNEPSSAVFVKKKRKTRVPKVTKINKNVNKSSDVEVAPRRSSSRKSKDTAMRLIELQADSNYSGVNLSVEEEEDKKTRKKRVLKRRFAPATDESNEDSEGDGQENSSDKEFNLGEDDLAVLNNDKMLEEESDKKAHKEKRIGGLKISIKLSANSSSAEIVSGIDDSPVKKKKKTGKKSLLKTKVKEKNTLDAPDGPTPVSPSNITGYGEPSHSIDIQAECVKPVQSELNDKTDETGSTANAINRPMSLLDKYFSAANSATVALQGQKQKVTEVKSSQKIKGIKAKTGKHAVTPAGKKLTEPPEVVKQKSPGRPLVESASKKDKPQDAEVTVPKFVCGYCPQRYHNKQELLSHMEAHMVEMEGKVSDEAAHSSDKFQLNSVVSKSNSALATSPNSGKTDKAKSKSAGDQDKSSKQNHNSTKPAVTCGECGQAFESKALLLDHVRIHTAEKPFECDICHKFFTDRNLLSTHRRNHGQDKLLRCQVCSKAFVHRADLLIHLQSHPKRSSGTSVLAAKKSLKKINSEVPPDPEPPVAKKPKSFASALTGDSELSDKVDTAASILILSRNEGLTTEAKHAPNTGNKSFSHEPKAAAKPLVSDVHKPNLGTKAGSHAKLQTDLAGVTSKDGNTSISSNHETGSSKEGKTADTSAQNVCSCKECPECVTRFLQSFE